MIDVIIRQYVPSDESYIYATGLRSWRALDNSVLPDELWFPAYRELLNRLLASDKVEVLIACSSDMPNEILGYIIAQPGEALWLVYVRKSLRREGLCRQLMKAAKVDQTTPSALPVKPVNLRNPCRSRQLRAAQLTVKR